MFRFYKKKKNRQNFMAINVQKLQLQWKYFVFSVMRKFIFYFLVNNQLDVQFFFRIYLFQFSTCFEHPCAHHQENQLY
jgi:hypothetical protein